MLYDPQIGVKSRYDAKAWMAAVQEGLYFLKAAGFSSIAALDKIQELNLALFYFVGMSYYKSVLVDDAVACLSIVYSQTRFLHYILSDYKVYPHLAGKALLEIGADRYPTREAIEAYLKKTFAKSGGCFVATAACGDPFAPEVITLSTFRDEVLLRCRFGRLFVRLYYVVSPPIAAVVARSPFLRRVVRTSVIRPLSRIVQTWNGDL